ncbi:hypothetical protein [Deinococcus sonorensis]|uniref:Lipoprotein n=2 Tax=Deinococcus sonorensis TaxID=309891 RepID=A0AAU7U4L8_9DEIO
MNRKNVMWMLSATLGATAFVSCGSPSAQPSAQETGVISSTRNDTSAPLSSFQGQTSAGSSVRATSNLSPSVKGRGSSQAGRIGVQALPSPNLPQQAPAATRSFDGMTNEDNRKTIGGRVLPPDTVGDVGYNYYVQAVNEVVGVFDKTSGARVMGPVSLDSFWSGFGPECRQGSGDPIVLFDHLANRFLITQMRFPILDGNAPEDPAGNGDEIGPGEDNEGGDSSRPPISRDAGEGAAVKAGDEAYECVAVSATADPRGAYYRYAFKIADDQENDYPKLGVWPDGYYMTFNMFGEEGYEGIKVAAAERSRMLSGQPARLVLQDIPADNGDGSFNFSAVPTDLDGDSPPPGTANTIVMLADRDFHGFSTDSLRLWDFKVNWANPRASKLQNPRSVAVAPLDGNLCDFERQCIPQAQTSNKLDPSVGRIMLEAQYRKFQGHGSLVLNHTVDATGNNLAGVRWYELRAPGSSTNWSVYQQGTFVDAGLHTWMASIGMNKLGEIGMGYSTSSTSTLPAIAYTFRNATDPLGRLDTGRTLITSTKPQYIGLQGDYAATASRWGDYSALSVDPSDDCTFWYTNEYYGDDSPVTNLGAAGTYNIGWKTRIGSFRSPNCH